MKISKYYNRRGTYPICYIFYRNVYLTEYPELGTLGSRIVATHMATDGPFYYKSMNKKRDLLDYWKSAGWEFYHEDV